ncbi:MAG TPA: hypothetical protein VHO28_06245, partial [Ignavibacteriales bacterium]|nr:hypothetical protein [Ignavibacteriales bacterium]
MKNIYKFILFSFALISLGALPVLAQSITVTSPATGDRWEAGTSKKITWSFDSISDDVNVQYSTNGGSSWSTIATVPVTDGEYDWTIPAGLGLTNAQVRVRTANAPTYTGTSSSFVIGRFVVTAPAAGAKLGVGQVYTITWTENPTALSANIEYSTDGGTTWIAVASNIGGTTYNWTVPNTPSNNCKLRVKDYNGPADPAPIIDDISGAFSIGRLTLTSPNGGVYLKAGETSIISWTASQVTLINIDYSTDNGGSWINIISNKDATALSHSWMVPNNPSSQVL